MVKGFAHIALYTDKFEQIIEFYKDVFEADELGYFETDKRACWLAIGDDILEIFEDCKYEDGSFKHIGIECDNVDELFNKALENGAAPHVYPKDVVLSLSETVNARIAFVKGINSEQIELFEKHK